MFLKCYGWKELSSEQTDCRTYFDNGTLTPVNRYSIRESSHNSVDRRYLNDSERIFEDFVNVVNSQEKYNNKNGEVNGIPIIAYHDFDDNGIDTDSTDVNLFEREMRYLYENGFRVFTMADLGYDERNNHIYIKQSAS